MTTVGASTHLAGREFQTGTTRFEKKILTSIKTGVGHLNSKLVNACPEIISYGEETARLGQHEESR